MKKLLFAALLVAGSFSVSAQDTKFGVKAGVDLASVKVDLGPLGDASESYTGFFVGGFANIGVSESFSVQPELLYVSLPDDFSFLNIPVMAKFKFDDFSVFAGPDLNYFLNAEEDQFKVNVGVGAGYQITENIDVSAKYSMGMGDVKVSGIFIGVGYAF